MSDAMNNLKEPTLLGVPLVKTDSEIQCLGLMMDDHTLVPFVRRHLEPADFYKDSHSKLAKTIFWLADKDVQPDLATVVEALDSRKELEGIGGVPGVYEILDSVPSSSPGALRDNILWHARQVKEASSRRELIQLLLTNYHKLQEYDPDVELDSLIGKMIEEIFRITQVVDEGSIRDELNVIFKMLATGNTYGISTGLPSLDRITCGYQNGELYVIAGRPGMGKTALAIKLMINLLKADRRIFFVSLEMPKRQVLLRTLSIVSQVPYRCFRERDAMTDAAWPKVTVSGGEILEWPWHIDDQAGLHVEQIAARVQAECHRYDVDVVFIDHMHLIPANGFGNNAEAYGYISLVLKDLARRLDKPVICLSQLSRNVEHRTNKRPQLSDLRESGAIEQNADNVWMLYRPDYYPDNDGERSYSSIEKTELIVVKNKSLETGTVNLEFHGAFMEFIDPHSKGQEKERKVFGYE